VLAAIVLTIVGLLRLRRPIRLVRAKAAAFDDMPIARALAATSDRVARTSDNLAGAGVLWERLAAALASVETSFAAARATAAACAEPYRRAGADLSLLWSLFAPRSNGRRTPGS
jgi:hypothetical protein